MKKLLAIFAIALSAQSFAWQVRPGVWFNYTNASAQVFNNFNRPIVCRGYIVAQTMYGNRLESWLNNSIIFPGQYQGIFVYSNMNDPITGAWANAECYWY
jgi:hypothetical protein